MAQPDLRECLNPAAVAQVFLILMDPQRLRIANSSPAGYKPKFAWGHATGPTHLRTGSRASPSAPPPPLVVGDTPSTAESRPPWPYQRASPTGSHTSVGWRPGLEKAAAACLPPTEPRADGCGRSTVTTSAASPPAHVQPTPADSSRSRFNFKSPGAFTAPPAPFTAAVYGSSRSSRVFLNKASVAMTRRRATRSTSCRLVGSLPVPGPATEWSRRSLEAVVEGASRAQVFELGDPVRFIVAVNSGGSGGR